MTKRTIILKSDEHQKFQGTPYFKERIKHRYRIESKNVELKHRHGLDTARALGLFNVGLQVVTTLFVVKYEEDYNSNKPKIIITTRQTGGYDLSHTYGARRTESHISEKTRTLLGYELDSSFLSFI